MWIDLENIRNATITSDEWVEITNIMAQEPEMTDADYERMPGMREWMAEVKKIANDFREERECLDIITKMAQENGYNVRVITENMSENT